jgi:hypothetical protein
MLYAHTRDHNASTNADYTNEVCRLRPRMADDYPQSRAACDHVTRIGNTRIARHRSFIKLKFIKNFCLSCKTLADQVTRDPRYHCTSISSFIQPIRLYPLLHVGTSSLFSFQYEMVEFPFQDTCACAAGNKAKIHIAFAFESSRV